MLWAYLFDQGQSFSDDVKSFGINLIKHNISVLLVCRSVLHRFHMCYFYHIIEVSASSDFTFVYTVIDQGYCGTCVYAMSLRHYYSVALLDSLDLNFYFYTSTLQCVNALMRRCGNTSM